MSAPYSNAHSMPSVLPPYGNAIGDFPLSSGTGGNTAFYETKYCSGGSRRMAQRTGKKMGQSKTMRRRTMGGKKRRHWSAKYKRSIDCSRPRGFSQRQHCKYGRKK